MFIDVAFFILMILAIFKGYSKGVIVALFSIFAFVIGLAAAIKLSAIAAVHIKNNINITNQWLPILSFALVFIAVIIMVRLGAMLIEKAVRLAMLGWINRIGGVILYIFLYTIILSILLFYINKMGLVKVSSIQESKTYPYIADIGPMAIRSFSKAVPIFKGMFSQLEIFFEQVAHKAA